VVTVCPTRFKSKKFDILPTDYICAFNLNLITNRELVFIRRGRVFTVRYELNL